MDDINEISVHFANMGSVLVSLENILKWDFNITRIIDNTIYCECDGSHFFISNSDYEYIKTLKREKTINEVLSK